jgi:hypothetical protein
LCILSFDNVDDSPQHVLLAPRLTARPLFTQYSSSTGLPANTHVTIDSQRQHHRGSRNPSSVDRSPLTGENTAVVLELYPSRQYNSLRIGPRCGLNGREAHTFNAGLPASLLACATNSWKSVTDILSYLISSFNLSGVNVFRTLGTASLDKVLARIASD